MDRFGVFALQVIPAHRKIIEYTGERISVRKENSRQRKRLAKGKMVRCYYFSLNRHWGINGAVGGVGAELINHSCDPNIKERIVRGHILYFSRRRIRCGEELAIDYRFSHRAKRVPCRCGSPKCRGTINLLRSKPRSSR
jgi:SET domain-containing protein